MVTTNLDDILSQGDCLKLSELSYEQVKKAALAQSKYEVVIVDFSAPDHLYSGSIYEKEHILRPLRDKAVIFFHENVEQATPAQLGVARAHMGRAGRNHFFVTTFDADRLNQYSPAVASTYSGVWGRYVASSEQITYLEQKLKEIETEVVKAIEISSTRTAFNITGEPDIGKTILLHGLAKHFSQRYPGVHYNSMEEYGNTPLSELSNLLRQHNPRPEVLLLDEAGLVSLELHQELHRAYRCMVYASLQPLAFPDIQGIPLQKVAELLEPEK